MENNLYNELPNEELVSLKERFSSNPTIVNLIDGILEARSKAEEAERVKAEFQKKVAKLAKLPPPPEGTYNLFLHYGETIDEEAEEVEVRLPNGETEMRKPRTMGWIVETNHVDKLGSKAGKDQTSTTSSEGKKIWARNGDTMTLLLQDVSWRDAIRAINSDASKLAMANQNKLGHRESGETFIIETTASGKKDLEAAGFICTTD